MAFDKGRDREEQLKAEAVQKVAAETSIPVDVLSKALAAAMKEVVEPLTAMQRRPQVPYGQHSRKTAFNPKGKESRPVKYIVFQNGYRVNPHVFFDEEIAMINSGKIKPGKYINNLVRVLILDEDGPEPQLHFAYKNERADQRMALGSLLTGPEKTGFARMCRMIIEERAAQDEQAKKNRRREIEEAMADDPLDEVNN